MTGSGLLLTLTLAAGVALPAIPLKAQEADTCNRSAMSHVIGETSFVVTNVIYEIAAYAPEQIVRYLRPGDDPGAVRASRLSVVFDADGRVTRVYCG